MKKILLHLRLMFWCKALRTYQYVNTRIFIPGQYVCVNSVTSKRLEIKRISEIADVYEVTLEDVSSKDKWVCYFDNRVFVLFSHDYEKTITFIPEEGSLTYGGLIYTKTISNN